MEVKLTEITPRFNNGGTPLRKEASDAQRLASSIERAVRRETSGGVRNLHVEINRGRVVLEGRCDTYYCKQLAQHAAMTVSHDPLTNKIRVS